MGDRKNQNEFGILEESCLSDVVVVPTGVYPTIQTEEQRLQGELPVVLQKLALKVAGKSARKESLVVLGTINECWWVD